MRIRFFIILILVNIQTGIISAQVFQDESCGSRIDKFSFKHETWEGNNKYLTELLDSIGYYSGEETKILYRIPIKFHIYRGANKLEGLEEKEIREWMNYINYYHTLNKTGLSFYMSPDIEYINSTRHKRLGYFIEGPVQTAKKKTDGMIDVLVAKNLTKSIFGIKGNSYFGTYNGVTKGIIIRKNSASQTMSHEIGHYLGLKHPHHNYKKGKRKQESVSRTRKVKGIFRHGLNCENNGDKLCDTPAEPELTNYTDKDCNYKGTKKDNWGESYKPDVKNIMSYTFNRECRDAFTPLQTAVMLNSAATNKYGSGWSTSSSFSKNYEYDVFEPNDTQEMASEIFENTPQDHTFHMVFAGFKKDDINKDVDWLMFEQNAKTKKSYIIKVTNNTYTFAKVSITVFDKFGKIKESSKVTTEFKMDVENLARGKYFIKIEQIGVQSKITGYKIELQSK